MFLCYKFRMAQAGRYTPGKFTWFEHRSSDAALARRFYESLFGWHVTPMQMGAGTYDVIQNAGQGIGGIVQASGAAHWLGYLTVDDVDASHAHSVKAGAAVVTPPSELASTGRMSVLADPQGAVLALFHPRGDGRPDADNVPAGDWVWNELSTSDPAKAVAFYAGVFGYSCETMDMGDAGKYFILKTPDGKGRAGVMALAQAGAPATWMPYVRVEQCDDTASRVAPLGARLTVPPTDIPTIGRFAALTDPLGAAVAFIQMAVT